MPSDTRRQEGPRGRWRRHRPSRGGGWRIRQGGIAHIRPWGHFGGTAGVERRADSVRRLEVFGGAFCPENLLIGGICTEREISRLAALARDDKWGENTAPFLEKVFLFQRVNSSEIEKKVR